MTSCTTVASPGVEDERSEEAEVPLAGPACPFVLRTVARLNYSDQDSGPGFRHQRSGSHHERSLQKGTWSNRSAFCVACAATLEGRLLVEWQELLVHLVSQVHSD